MFGVPERGESVQVHHAVDTVVVILQSDVVLDGAQIIAQVLAPGGPSAGKDSSLLNSAISYGDVRGLSSVDI
jgi:hypothetical protein